MASLSPSVSVLVGGEGFQSIASLAVTEATVTVVGTFQDQFQYGELVLSPDAGLDGYALGITETGEPRFAYAFAGAGDDGLLTAVACGDGGSLLGGHVTLGAAPFGKVLTERTEWTALVAKLAPDGAPLWDVVSDGEGSHSVMALAEAPDGAIYAAGDFSGTLIFGELSITARGPSDGFVARFHAGGQIEWLAPIVSEGDGRVEQLVVAANAVYVGGYFDGSLSVGDREELDDPAFDRTPFAAKLEPSTGAIAWAQVGLIEHAAHEHEMPGEADDMGEHSAHTAYGGIALSVTPAGEALALVAYGDYSGAFGEDFEAPAISHVAGVELTAEGRVHTRAIHESPNSLVQLASLLRASDAAQIVGSFSGELSLDGPPFRALGPRSLFFSRVEGGALGEARQAAISGISLTGRAAVQAGDSVWVAAQWLDLQAYDFDAWIARFEP